VGYSDHSSDPIIAPRVAVILGAKIIEKHITLDKKMPGPDHFFALNPKELVLMGFFSAIFNCLSHHFYFKFANLRATWPDCGNMFIGDLFGIGIMLSLFLITLKVIRKSTILLAKD
jgi:hypothetical protein